MKHGRHILALLLFACATASYAQYTNTFYFMDEISTRNQMNPAFLPRCKSYFDFILLPNVSLNVGENVMSVSDIFYQRNGRTSNFLSDEATIDKFLNDMSDYPYAKANFNLNILNFGTQVKRNHYLIFDFNLRGEVTSNIPKDLFRFALKGTPDPFNTNHFDLSDLDIETNAYATAGIGYSGRLHKKVTFGIKAKALFGFMNATTTIDKLDFDASTTQWNISSQSHMNVTTPIPVNYKHTNGDTIDFKSFSLGSVKDIRPAGYGASFDIGITYEPIEHLVISASVTDLGFISWKGYNYDVSLVGDYQYDGLFGTINFNDSVSSKEVSKRLEDLGNNIKNDVRINSSSGYTAMITGRFNAGIEYGVLKNKISFGVMNQMSFNKTQIYDELTLAVNFRPCQWFKASFSYSFLNYNWGTIGVGLNLNLGGFSWYIISDYVPVSYSEMSYKQDGATKNIILPDRMRFFNLQTGVVFNLHRFERDTDDDGVTNGRDKCKDTDMDFLRRQCPDHKDKQIVDKNGCILDEDYDGICDCFDKCPNTPAGIEVDSVGCPLDSDHDGVYDSEDICPDTPEGVDVDSNGCPLDGDADGVPDYKDNCPATPLDVKVDSVGCPVDKDGDGVPDYLDKCPDTKAGFPVDENGCPMDQDGDGVPDNIDRCPDTPKDVEVDSFGCPIDSDGDSIPDYLDRCPDIPGVISNDGCPELTEINSAIEQAVNGIQFDNAKSTIKKSSYPILDKMVSILKRDNVINLEIYGHTDNTGNPEKNMTLSEERAAAVRHYFIEHGIDADRLTSYGCGDTKPVADNNTAKGREKNRRVEFVITYDKNPNNRH